jgi:hypothetical protein
MNDHFRPILSALVEPFGHEPNCKFEILSSGRIAML